MMESARIGLLIVLAGLALLFCMRQWRTWRAVPIAAVAITADAYERMTTSALKYTAVRERHLLAPIKGLYRNVRKSDALCRCIVQVTADVPRGPGVPFLAPTSIGSELSILL